MDGLTTGDTAFWNLIWALEVPAKIKNFMWRVVAQCLPTGKALRLRHVNISGLCPLCNSCIEDDFHVFVHCSYARQLWNLSPIRCHSVEGECFIKWWISLAHQCSKAEMNVAAVMQYARTAVSRSDSVLQPISATVSGRWQRPRENLVKCKY
ncbi:hypothetical protein DITRI_Ditri17bG0132800 [Diplodiscus trichospermus]